MWPGPGGKVRRNVSVSVDSGRISSMERVSSAPDVFMMPSFVDAHCHFVQMGLKRACLDLSNTRSARQLLAEAAAVRSSGSGILLGEGFDDSTWDDPALPSLGDMDAAFPDRPVFLRRICGHMALLNSRMMEILPPGLDGVDDARGIAREEPVLRFRELFPPSEGEIEKAARAAFEMCATSGVTGVGALETLGRAAGLGELVPDMSFACYVPYTDMDALKKDRPEWVKGVKFFLDGSIGAETAATGCGYLTGAEPSLLWDSADLEGALSEVYGAGLYPVMHAIGAKAIEQAGRASKTAWERSGGTGNRIARIEHAEELSAVPAEALDPSFHRLSMQPNFVLNWQARDRLYGAKLPWEAVEDLNPFRSVLERGFRLAFGSDGMPFGPLAGLAGATEHPNRAQRLGVVEALAAYTTDSAALCGLGELSTPIGVGRRADMVLLSRNPFDSSWSGVEVVATVSGGRIVYGEKSLGREVSV